MFRKIRIRNAATGFVSILRWSVIASLIGAVCGFVGTGFYYAVGWADAALASFPLLLLLLPAAGIAIVALNKVLGTEHLTTDSILLAVQRGGKLPLTLVPAIIAGTVLTHLCGGSAGKEGAAFQIGGTIGNRIARLLKQNDYEIRIATMAGMAALFSSIFGLPVTATIFVVLVISVGSFWHSSIYPVMIASFVARWISGSFGAEKVAFPVEMPGATAMMMLRIAILAVLCAFLSTILCDSLHDMARYLAKKFPNPYWRAVMIGAVIVLLMLTIGVLSGDIGLSDFVPGLFRGKTVGAASEADLATVSLEASEGSFSGRGLIYSGAGNGLIAQAVNGDARPWDFALKLLLTVLTLGAGFRGGEVLPSFAIGATFGCVIGPYLGIPAPFAAAIGLISVFGGASNSLIAPLFLGIEMFGADGLSYYAIAAILAYIMSGYAGFYYNQVIVYSKISPARILIHANEEHDQLGDVRGETHSDADEK